MMSPAVSWFFEVEVLLLAADAVGIDARRLDVVEKEKEEIIFNIGRLCLILYD